MRRPYVRPNPTARAWARAVASLLVDDDDPVDAPPKPVKVLLAEVSPVLAAPPPEVVAAAVEEMVEVFTRTGCWAPQGKSVRQALWQDGSVCSHLLTQSVPALMISSRSALLLRG